jgi:nucleotide-binding universal stress UspA family protein
VAILFTGEMTAMPLIGDRPDLNLNAVIFATDFSVCSENAGLYAALMAELFSAKLLVTHAFTLSQAAMEVELDPSMLSQQRKNLQLLLTEEASSLASDSIEAIPILLDGNPDEVLPRLADKYQPSLLVLGTHGGGWVERKLIGSVAEKVLRSTRWPALTIGPQVRAATSGTWPFHHILYATDLTAAAARAAVFAVLFAQAFGAEIDVLNVIAGGAVDHPDRLGEIRRRFYSALDAVVPEQAKEFCNARTFVEVGNAHEQILNHIKERSIDLLILGIKKTSHLGMETRTSGAFQLVVDAECPVLTVTG